MREDVPVAHHLDHVRDPRVSVEEKGSEGGLVDALSVDVEDYEGYGCAWDREVRGPGELSGVEA